MKIIKLFFLLFVSSYAPCQLTEGQLPMEELSLVTNNQLYLTGEQIHLQVVCSIQGESIPGVSKHIYLELIDASNRPVLQQINELENGRYEGTIFLPSSLKTGNYLLAAYTRLSGDGSNRSVFTRTIGIVNPFLRINSQIFGELEKDSTSKPVQKEIEISVSNEPDSSGDSLSFSIAGSGSSQQDNLLLSIQKADARSLIAHEKSEVQDLPSEAIIPELRGFILKGKLLNEADQPVSAPISLTNTAFRSHLKFARSDANGNFQFVLEPEHIKHKLLLKTREPLKIMVDNPFIKNHNFDIPPLVVPAELKPWILKRAQEIQIEDNYFSEKFERQDHLLFPGLLDGLSARSYLLDDYTRFPTTEDPIIEYISETRVKKTENGKAITIINLPYYGASDSTLVLLNGVPVSSREIFSQDPGYIERITIYPHYVLVNHFEFAGIVHYESFDRYEDNIRFENQTVVDYSYVAYVPKTIDPTEKFVDLKNQLIWEPIDLSEGDVKEKKFKASQSSGTYTIKVLRPDGQTIGSQTFTIGEPKPR